MKVSKDDIEKVCEDLKNALNDLLENGQNDADEMRVNYCTILLDEYLKELT